MLLWKYEIYKSAIRVHINNFLYFLHSPRKTPYYVPELFPEEWVLSHEIYSLQLETIGTKKKELSDRILWQHRQSPYILIKSDMS